MSTDRRGRRAAVAVALGALAALVLAPGPAAGHAIGQVYTLPVPSWLYLAGAAAAVAASFVISVVLVGPPGAVPTYWTRPIGDALARWTSVVLQALGLAWWFGAIIAGYLVDPISPLPAVLFWIGIWVGLPIAAVVLGNPWPSLSPFRTLFGLLSRLAHFVGVERLDAGLRYPPELARWPAVILLFAAGWSELILAGGSAPQTIANLLLAYTVLTLVGMMLFGSLSWLRSAELFEVLLGWFGRVGPIGRRVIRPETCAECGEACDPARCIDCPECAVAAGAGDRSAELRRWFAGLTEVRHAGWSDAAFIVLALATVTYDGLGETAFWGGVMNPLFEALWQPLGPVAAVYTVQTAGMLAIWLGFLAAFAIAAAATRRLHDPGREPGPLGSIIGAYAATLLPIAGGYFIAHYLTLVIQGAIWLPELLGDPLVTLAPTLDWMPTSAIWYASVGAIVLGHVVAVVLAHRLALRDAARRPVLAGLPLVVLMIGYTVLSLWIISVGITQEPGTTPSALLPSLPLV